MCYCPTPTLHLNLALTGDGAFLLSLKKTHSVWFISVLNYGDTENVLINHLLLVIPMSYPCHYTNLCPHKPHKHAHTHTHTHTHTHPPTHTHTHTPPSLTASLCEQLSSLYSYFSDCRLTPNIMYYSEATPIAWMHQECCLILWVRDISNLLYFTLKYRFFQYADE